MSDELLFLRQNIQVEPLVDQWYAWSHLISPATASRNITERHLRIIDSYIAAPTQHVNATKNPQMLGGPFVDYDSNRVNDIKELRAKTMRNRSKMIELSGALGDLNSLLTEGANGYSLEPLYERVPPMLRGYVELAYDLNNRPCYRLLEPLLYASEFHDERAQSIALSSISGDDRPFILSTPRLDDRNAVILQIAFRDNRLDFLFRMKTAAESWAHVRQVFEVPQHREALFRSFFTEEPPAPYEKYSGSGIRWRYFGHACILIETANLRILLDPVLSYTYEAEISRYTYADLPDTIDFVLITHNHQDHILIETLLQIRHKVATIVVPRNSYGTLQDPSLRLVFESMGFKHVVELGDFQSVALPNGEILALPFFGEHADLAIGTKAAYLVRIGDYKLLFAADSCNVEPLLYKHLRQVVGSVDVVFIGMECDGAPLSWLYGPLLPHRFERALDQSRRLAGSNYDQAAQIVDALGPREVYVYAMGQEPWLNYVMSIKYTDESRPIVESKKLLAHCLNHGIWAERLFGEKEILVEDGRVSSLQSVEHLGQQINSKPRASR